MESFHKEIHHVKNEPHACSKHENAASKCTSQTKSDGNKKSRKEHSRRKSGFFSSTAKVRFRSRDNVMVRPSRSCDEENDHCKRPNDENGGKGKESNTKAPPSKKDVIETSTLKRQALVSLPLPPTESPSHFLETEGVEKTRRHVHSLSTKPHLTPSERADRALARRHAEALLAARARAARETDALCRKAMFLESRLTAATTRLVKARSARPSLIPSVHYRTCTGKEEAPNGRIGIFLSRPESPPDKILSDSKDPKIFAHGDDDRAGKDRTLRKRNEKEISTKKSHPRQPKVNHNSTIRIPTPTIPSVPTLATTKIPDHIEPTFSDHHGSEMISTDDNSKVESETTESKNEDVPTHSSSPEPNVNSSISPSTIIDKISAFRKVESEGTESKNEDVPNPHPHSSSPEPEPEPNENSSSTIIDKISVFNEKIARSSYTRQAFLKDHGLPPGFGMTQTDKNRCLQFRDRIEEKIVQLVRLYCTLDDKIGFAISAEAEYGMAVGYVPKRDFENL